MSFNPGLNPSPYVPIPCPHTTIGGYVTIVPPPEQYSVPPNEDDINVVTAKARKHLQEWVQSKFMQASNKCVLAGRNATEEEAMGDLVRLNVVLIPIVIGPHGKWGPMMENFLIHWVLWDGLIFPTTHPHANQTYDQATSTMCPLGIVMITGII